MTVVLAFGGGCAASAQQGASAMAKLHWMAGSWTCEIVGNHPNTPTAPNEVDHLSYRFVGGGAWIEEYSDFKYAGSDQSSIQMWGYDAAQKRLVAYQFNPNGIATKSVDGWVNGVFVSHRDDNGATVSILPKGPKAFEWLIVSKDQTYTVREECKR